MPSLFVDRGMDWKLGGFELLIEASAADAEYFAMAKETLPRFYQSSELARGQVWHQFTPVGRHSTLIRLRYAP